MASNSIDTATRLPSPNKRNSKRGKYRITGWEKVKAEAVNLYKTMSKKKMMAAMVKEHNFDRCEKSWSTKLAEWGVTKNRRSNVTDAPVATEKRKLEECKDTKDFHKGTRVTEERNGTYKKRRTGQASYKMGKILHTQSLISGRTARATPLEVTMNTESNLKSDEYILEKTCDEFIPNLLSLSLESNIYIPPDGSVQSLEPGSQSRSAISRQRHVELISRHDYYLADEDQTWNNLGRQPTERGAKLSKIIHAEHFTPSTRVCWSGWSDINLLSAQNIPPELCGIGAQFFEDPKILALTSALTEVENKCGILAKETLLAAQHLAIALQETYRYGEAEYYFRRILSIETRIMVQIRLGIILASPFSSRVEEATSLLFLAVTEFIANFCLRPPKDNIYILTQMEYLFDDILQYGVLDESVLRPRMFQILTIVRRANSDETRNKLFSPLLIQGLYLANECSVPGLFNSAQHLYKVLLQNSSHLDRNLYGTEMASAHQIYGQLLRREQKWACSAEQLLLACEMAFNLKTDNRWQVALLKSDCIELLPHLDNSPGKDGPLVDRLTYMISHGLRQNSIRLQHSLDASHLFRVRLAGFEVADLSYITPLDLSSTASNSENRERNTVSTGSISGKSRSSNKFGETLTFSEFNGMNYLENISA